MKKLVIIGATSVMATHCARLWLKDQFDHIVLVARNKEKLIELQKDLEVRSKGLNITLEVEIKVLDDFCDDQKITLLINEICREQLPHTVLIAQGSSLTPNAELQQDLAKLKSSLELNALSPILFLEGFVDQMIEQNEAHIGVIGSVAGDRGRLTNYIYGAGKGCVERFVEGLVHRLGNERIALTVTLIKPGPTATPMTIDLPNQASLAPVDLVASNIVKAINKGKRVIYTPIKWKWIMLIIRNLPYFIFNHLKI